MGALELFQLDYVRGVSPARRRVVVERCATDIASRVELVNFIRSSENSEHITYTISLRPRKFNEIADHFTRVTRRVDWPVDEADVE